MTETPLNVVYIAGLNYSGSTLLALLLNGHPLIRTTGEVTGPPNFARGRPFTCSCGVPIADCRFYNELERRVAMPGFDLSRGRWETGALNPHNRCAQLWLGSLRNSRFELARDLLRQSTQANRLFEEKRRLNVQFAANAAEMFGTRILVDSSKSPMQLQFYAASPEIRLKVIHLVRHPAGCATSAAKHNGHALEYAATLWKRNYATCARQAARFAPRQTLQLRYEDLCNTPQESLRRVCRFLCVDYADEMMEFDKSNAGADLHVVGNDMRLRGLSKIVLHEEWRNSLSPSQVETALHITRPESLSAGYAY